jgi:RNA-binding protein YhbY
MTLIKLQIGKNGLTKEFIEGLKFYFKSAESIRISVLKSGSRNKEQVKLWVKEILSSLGGNYRANIIGYTIVLRKLRKAVDIGLVNQFKDSLTDVKPVKSSKSP